MLGWAVEMRSTGAAFAISVLIILWPCVGSVLYGHGPGILVATAAAELKGLVAAVAPVASALVLLSALVAALSLSLSPLNASPARKVWKRLPPPPPTGQGGL